MNIVKRMRGIDIKKSLSFINIMVKIKHGEIMFEKILLNFI